MTNIVRNMEQLDNLYKSEWMEDWGIMHRSGDLIMTNLVSSSYSITYLLINAFIQQKNICL